MYSEIKTITIMNKEKLILAVNTFDYTETVNVLEEHLGEVISDFEKGVGAWQEYFEIFPNVDVTRGLMRVKNIDPRARR